MTVRPPGASSIIQAVEKRGETDTQPSYYVHVVLPFILILASLLVTGLVAVWQVGHLPTDQDTVPVDALGTIAAISILASLVILASIALMFRGWYLLIQRRNGHIARDRVLRQGILDYIRRLAEANPSETSGDHLRSMQRLHNDALMDENERPAAVHLLLYVLTAGLWGFYVLYFLIKDLPVHSQRQSRFVREARGALDVSGMDPDAVPTVPPTREHSYLASLALWIFVPVVGPFIVTWWLFEDPIDHFDKQWAHEDALVSLVQDSEVSLEPSTPTPEAPSSEPRDEADDETPPPDTGTDEPQEEPAPEYTIWECGECESKYKVPPKRPVRVTCKNCSNKEVLEEGT